MTITARQVIRETLGSHACSVQQLAGEVLRRCGIEARLMYAVTRETLRDMEQAKEVESTGEGLNQCWRLPARKPKAIK